MKLLLLKTILGLPISFSEGIAVEKRMGVNWTNPDPYDTWGAIQVFNSSLWRAHVRSFVKPIVKKWALSSLTFRLRPFYSGT